MLAFGINGQEFSPSATILEAKSLLKSADEGYV
jgi:hypothetical protein